MLDPAAFGLYLGDLFYIAKEKLVGIYNGEYEVSAMDFKDKYKNALYHIISDMISSGRIHDAILDKDVSIVYDYLSSVLDHDYVERVL